MMRRVAMVLGVLVPLSGACAQPTPDYDFQWATVGAAGNPAWQGEDPLGINDGRGSVGYEYRISKLEVTTAQWMEFVNTYSVRGGAWTFFALPVGWGAYADPTYSGPGRRYRLIDTPGAANFPVQGMSWREAAMYVNWLCNDKGSTPEAIQRGAYDVATFTTNSNGTFNDQIVRSPGAKFWIPSLDEWLKAAFYDPNRYGQGAGGWWNYVNRSDSLGVPGLPGEGTTSAGLEQTSEAFHIPLGAYADQVSPWGLWDTSGGTKEWLEETLWPGFHYNRLLGGSWAGDPIWYLNDSVVGHSSLGPQDGATGSGLRVASSVPGPGVVGSLSIVSFLYASRRGGRNKRGSLSCQ